MHAMLLLTGRTRQLMHRRAARVLLVAALSAAALSPLGPAHAQSQQAAAEDPQLPAWIESIFAFYADGLISDAELVGALEYLVSAGVISVQGAGSGSADGKIADEGDFYLAYGPNPGSAYEQSAAEWLRENGLLDEQVEWLNEHFRLPYDVTVSAEECGQINAFYDPREKKVIMCYEYVDDLFDMWYMFSEGSDPAGAEDFAYDATYATFYHEVGHALVDVYDLPYTGREENVADQFEALVLSYTYGDDVGHALGQDMLYNVGSYYLYSAQRSDGEFPYWDTHGSDMQRFYNISCYAYGADPEYNWDLVEHGWLPEDRAAWCEDEYDQMEYAWSYLLQDYTNGFFD